MEQANLMTTLLATAIGGGTGYLVGKNSNVNKAPDPASDAATISGLNQRVSLLQAQAEASAALIAAMKDQSSTGQAVQAQLQATIADLNSKIAGQQVTLFTNFPAVFGTGDPSVGGWIQGRDGMLISRTLANFLHPNSRIGTSTGYNGAAIATSMAVSDITAKLAARPITIGRSVNTQLQVTHRTGIFGSMATVLNFAEDVADDPDFIVRGACYASTDSYPIMAMVIPIGRKSLMLMPMYFQGAVPSGYTFEEWQSNLLRDVATVDAAAALSLPTAAQRRSYLDAGLTLSLSHRTARSLTLRSWNVVAHPLAQWQESSVYNMSDRAMTESRRQGDVTVVTRLNSGLTPKFYRPDELGAYNSVEISQSSYM